VYNTGLTGYQEILTDPSYAGQIVTMTCPEIGNYGVAPADVESRGPQVAGFVMRSESLVASNWRAAGTLGDYLAASGVVAIAGIDTRALTRRLRSAGVMRGVIGTGDRDPAVLVEAARRAPLMAGSDLLGAFGAWAASPLPDWRVAVELIEAGYKKKNIYQKYVPGGEHSEKFWRSEFEEAILWLFP